MNVNSKPEQDEHVPLANLITEPVNKNRIIWTAVGGIALVLIVGLIIRHSHFDLAVVQSFNNLHHGKVASITNAVYKFFGPIYAVLGTVLLTGIIVAVTRSLRIGSTFAATIAATWVSLAAVKLIVDRVRPDASLLAFPFSPTQIDASYPSGHAAFVTALVVTIFLGVAIGHRWIAAILGGLLILGVGTALVINGVHFPSDVTASIVWGIAVAPLARLIWVSVILGAFDKRRAQRNNANTAS